ncbi:MAG: hypothetical protein WEB58_17750 [Planctomycetaceae bacterium]
MSLKDENKEIFSFNLLAEPGSGKTPLELLGLLNATTWNDKEPESCMVVEISQKTPVTTYQTAEFIITVGYRPRGYISDIRDNGRQRLNGWQLEVRNQRNDGTLLDGNGETLRLGAEPVYLGYDIYHVEEFNDVDFGMPS